MNHALELMGRPMRRALAVLTAMLLIAACGGGAGGEGGGTQPPSQETALSSVNFQSTQALIDNPERGYYRFASDLSVINEGFLSETVSQGYRLIYTPNDLSAWRAADLPQSYLDGLTAGFAKVRSAGLKVVLRFAYNYPANETEYQNAQDATLARVKAHIAQLSPVIAQNADVIAVWQAGFIGAWGEWHTSSNGLTSDANKLQVRDALLGALPEGRTLQVRYPGDLKAWFPTAPSASDLQLATLPIRARIGLHNDCFLASNDDVGTYFPAAQTSALRAHVQATSDVAAFGGETCWPPVPQEARMSCADILAEGAAYRLAYLNRNYYLSFFDSWTAGGCMDEIARKMGYRMELQKLEYSASVARGGTVTAALTLRNTGWGRLMNDRPIVIRLETAQGQVVHTETASPRTLRLLGAGQSERVLASSILPSSVPAGRYRITLGAPDASASLAATPAYALRFANADQGTDQYWDAARAVMITNAWIEVR